MKKIKKISLLTIPLMATTIFPIAFVACGKKDDVTPPPPKEKEPVPFPGKPGNGTTTLPPIPEITDPMKLNLKVNNVEFSSSEDAFYLIKGNDYYGGDVIDNEGENQNDGIVKLTSSTSVMLKENDSLILVFNDNEADDLNINNFTEKLFLKNSLLIPALSKAQATTKATAWEKVDTTVGETTKTDYYLNFKDGQLADKMYGALIDSQYYLDNKTPTKELILAKLRSWIPNLKMNYSNEYFNLLLKYYQLELRNGNYEYTNTTGDPEVNINVLPLSRPLSENLFTYEKIAKNAVKFTYHGNERSMTGLNFVLKNRSNNYNVMLKAIIAGSDEYNNKKYNKDNEATGEAKFNFVGSYNDVLNTQKGKAPVVPASGEPDASETSEGTSSESSDS